MSSSLFTFFNFDIYCKCCENGFLCLHLILWQSIWPQLRTVPCSTSLTFYPAWVSNLWALLFSKGASMVAQWQIICLPIRCRFDPWGGKIPWKGKWQPTPVFLPGKSHEQRSLVDYHKRAVHDLVTTHHQFSRKWKFSHSVVSNSLWPHGTVDYQAPPSMGFSRQEYWGGLPFRYPEDLPNPGIKHRLPIL